MDISIFPTSLRRLMLGALVALAGLFGLAIPAAAQSGEPNASARVATPGYQDLEVTGSGWSPGIAIFVLSCPGIAEVAEASGDTCDTSDLNPATASADGTFAINVRWFVPPEGLVFAVGDPGSTQFAASRVAVADRDPANGECRVLSGFQGVSLSWYPVEGAVEYVYRIDYANKVRYDRVTGDFASIAIESGNTVSMSLSAVFADGSYSAAQDCGSAVTDDLGASADCVAQPVDGGIFVGYPLVSGAVDYVWALKVNGGPISYDRVGPWVDGIWFDIGSGATGSVRISAVFADGTYSDNIQCVSVEAL